MKLLIAIGLLAVTISTALARSADVPYGFVVRVNAPGGAYIDCNPYNPNSPIRCTPDGW
jgi:hypothetical protein